MVGKRFPQRQGVACAGFLQSVTGHHQGQADSTTPRSSGGGPDDRGARTPPGSRVESDRQAADLGVDQERIDGSRRRGGAVAQVELLLPALPGRADQFHTPLIRRTCGRRNRRSRHRRCRWVFVHLVRGVMPRQRLSVTIEVSNSFAPVGAIHTPVRAGLAQPMSGGGADRAGGGGDRRGGVPDRGGELNQLDVDGGWPTERLTRATVPPLLRLLLPTAPMRASSSASR